MKKPRIVAKSGGQRRADENSLPLADLCSIGETGELLGVSRTRVRELLMKDGPLEPHLVGTRRFVTRRSIYQRLARMDTPPGVQRLLYHGRFLRDLTGCEPLKSYPHLLAQDWNTTLQLVAYALFGTDAAAPYRLLLSQAAAELLKAGKLRDWRRLDRARGEIASLWFEYGFTAAPIEKLPEWVAPKSLQVPLFEDEAA